MGTKWKNALRNVGPKTYRYVYEGIGLNGKRKQITGTFKDVDRKQAEEKLAGLKSQARTGAPVKNPKITVGEVIQKFMHENKDRLEVSTYERYDAFGRLYLIPAFGNVQVRHVHQSHLKEAYWKWHKCGVLEKPLTGRTVKHIHDYLRCVLNWGKRFDLVSRNVAELIVAQDMPPVDIPDPQSASEEEMNLLLDAAANPSSRSVKRATLSAMPCFGPAVAFTFYLGTRRGETVGVKRTAINWETEEISILESMAETKTMGRFLKVPKSRRKRKCAMPQPLIAILKEHLERQEEERRAMGSAYKDDGFLFALPDGSPMKPWNFAAAVDHLMDRLGLDPDMSLHNLRDSNATILVDNGVPIEVVSQRLGHANTQITYRRYVSAFSKADKAAADTLGRILPGQRASAPLDKC